MALVFLVLSERHEKKRIESQLQFNCCVKKFVTSFPEMPCIVADLVEGGPRLERRAEKVAPVPSMKITGWPPTVRVTRGSCAVMRTWAKVGSLGSRQSWSWVWVSDSWNLCPWGQLLFQWSPLQVGQGLGGDLCLHWGRCPLKCPSFPQWKGAPDFCFCPPTLAVLKLAPCRAIMRASAFLLSLLSFSLHPSWSLLKNTDVAALRRHSKSISGPKVNFWSSLWISGADWVINLSLRISWPSGESGPKYLCLLNASLSLSRKAVGFSSFYWVIPDSLE